MGYHDKCDSCYGRGKHWQDELCRKCGGTGKIAPYRRAINLTEGAALGWNEMESSPRYRDDKCCVSCNGPLPGRKRTFCGEPCRRAYLFRVWQGAHWQKRAVSIRDGAACRCCGVVFERPLMPGGKPYPDYSELQLDHVRPLHLGGTEAPDNCQLLCVKCHKSKSIRERGFSERATDGL